MIQSEHGFHQMGCPRGNNSNSCCVAVCASSLVVLATCFLSGCGGSEGASERIPLDTAGKNRSFPLSIGYHAGFAPVSAGSILATVKPGTVAITRQMLVHIPKDDTLPQEIHWEEDRLVGKQPGKPDKLLGVWINDEEDLLAIDPTQLKELWGIGLSWYTPKIRKHLEHVDFSRTALSLKVKFLDWTVQELPADVVWAHIAAYDYGLGAEFSQSWERLKHFSIYGKRRTFDLAWLQASPKLETLCLHNLDIVGYHVISTLQELKQLRLSRCDLNDIAFTSSLERLESLNIAGTKVNDLTPITRLPRLRMLDARSLPIKRLPPSALRSVKVINLMGVPTSVTSSFKKANQNCQVITSWSEFLKVAFWGADRLRVRSGSTCHSVLAEEATLYQCTSRDEIEKLLRLIDVNEARSDWIVNECERYCIEFYRRNELLGTVGVTVDNNLRWSRWPRDGKLTRQSSAQFFEWLSPRTSAR